MIALRLLALWAALVQQVTAQDLDAVLARADKLLEQAKAAYEEAREKSSSPAFVEAGFKLEDARIKYIVLQEIGTPEKQKIAAERLRSVNQLAKLIHDGRVAVSGSPADAKPLEPAPPPPQPGEAAKPAAAPVPVPVDVRKRVPVPDAAKLKDAEKLLKDLYKEEYAKKTQADRKALGRQLLAEAPKNRDDHAVFWVLCREAQDQAVQGCDLPTAMKAIDAAGEVFDIDGMALRNAALTATAKTAKTTEESAGVVAAAFKSIDELVANDQYDAADKLAQSMLPLARKSGNLAVYTQMTNRAKDAADAKGLYLGMKGVQETLAKNPEDPAANAEMGKFLCFVKGNWDLGLRFVEKGSDPVLKVLAEKELANPESSADRAGLADSWHDLGDKEKIALRKNQLLTHAKALYEEALPGASGLLKMKIEKILDGNGKGAVAGIDLLLLIDPKRDSVCGDWTLEGKTLVCSPTGVSRLQIPYTPPEEYDLRVVVERLDGQGSFDVGLAAKANRFSVELDCLLNRSGIQSVDGKTLASTNSNETLKSGPHLMNGKASTMVCSVRRGRVTVSVDGVMIIEYTGRLDRLSVDKSNTIPNPQALSFGTWGKTRLTISEAKLTPIFGEGTRLR